MAEEEFFVRKATGLTRNISMSTAIIMGFVIVVGLGWQKRTFQAVGWAPLPETSYLYGIPPMTMAFILTGIVTLLTCWILGHFSSAMPRSGSGYIAMTRIVHPLFGMIGGWMELMWFLIVIGLVSVVTFEATFIFSGLLGVDVSGLMHPESLFACGFALVLFYVVIACFGVRLWGLILQIVFWIPFGASIVMLGLLATATPTTMEAGVLALTGHTAQEYTKAALAQGMATAFKGDYWAATSVCILAAAWAWTGYASATFVAGEIKEAARRMPFIITFTGLFVLIIYAAATQLGAFAPMLAGKMDGYSFYTAFGYLSYGNGDLAKAGLSPNIKGWLPVVAAMQAAGIGQKILIPVVALVGIIGAGHGIPAELLASSRLIFAMAFDRVLPEKVAYVSERYHAPVVATILVGVGSLIGIASESGFIGAFQGWVAAGDLTDYIFLTFISISGILFPFRLKEIYKASPAKKHSIMGLPLIAVVAVAATAGNLWLDYIYIVTLTWQPALFTIAMVIVPVLIYYYYRLRAKVTKVDYGTIYTSLPPE